jgi:flavodoxin I
MLYAVAPILAQGLLIGGAAPAPSRVVAPKMAVGLIYSTTTGNTETVAGYLEAATGLSMVDIADCGADDISGFDGLICGAPTWHTGADTERSGTSWDDFIYGDLKSIDLKGKKVAIFGLGDQAGYSDNFCDAMDELKTCFEGQGAEVIGSWSAEGYDHMESKSQDGDKFVGLPCDEDNQPDMSEERVTAWVAQIKSEGMPL